MSGGYFLVAGVCGRGDRNQNVPKAWLGEDFGSKLLTCCPGPDASRAAFWAARKEGSFRGRPGQARNPGSVAITTPHNGWDYRTPGLGIIVSAIVLRQIPLAHVAHRHTRSAHCSRALPTAPQAHPPRSLFPLPAATYRFVYSLSSKAGLTFRGHFHRCKMPVRLKCSSLSGLIYLSSRERSGHIGGGCRQAIRPDPRGPQCKKDVSFICHESYKLYLLQIRKKRKSRGMSRGFSNYVSVFPHIRGVSTAGHRDRHRDRHDRRLVRCARGRLHRLGRRADGRRLPHPDEAHDPLAAPSRLRCCALHLLG